MVMKGYVLYLLTSMYPLVGCMDNMVRLAAISKIQQALFIESSGIWERNYVGLTELMMGSTKYLVTTSLTSNRTFHLYLFNDMESFLSNRSIHLPIELKMNDSSDHGLKPFQGPTSLRLFNVASHLYVMYATTVQHFAKLMVLNGNIFFHQHEVVVVDTSNVLVSKECRNNLHHWSPIPSHRIRKGYVNFMFICSIYPHRVLPMIYQKNQNNTMTHVQIVFDAQDLDMQTVLSHESDAAYFIQIWWPYGHIESTTTPMLMDTPYGQRFLSFFWSTSGKMIISSTNKMIFFGAYLFENSSTLRITHFSVDPVLVPSYYPQNMVPTESKMRNGSIFVMLKDRDGNHSYWMQLKTTAFLKTLREATSANLSANSDEKLQIIKNYHPKLKKGYHEIQFTLMDIRKHQYETFWSDEWSLINVPRNPSMVYYNGSFLLTSCICTNQVRWGSFSCYYQQYSKFLSRQDIHYFNHTLTINHDDHTNVPLMAEDMRLIVINQTRLFGIFSNHRPRKHNEPYHFDQFITELYLKHFQLYAKQPIMMNVSYESSMISQKNWIPFACPNVSMTGLCFVQSICPHIIVTSKKESFYKPMVGMNNMVVIAQSSYSPNNLWIYGELRGGSQAELVNTPYGQRYFALFHSSQERGEEKKGKKGIKTYYAGGYLFRSEYPYDITHMSTEPLAPVSFYNISQAWPHRQMDFVVFPMSLLIRQGIAYVSFGVQDRAGSIVSFKLDPFFSTMKSVSSRL